MIPTTNKQKGSQSPLPFTHLQQKDSHLDCAKTPIWEVRHHCVITKDATLFY